ncbi:MAG: hypothetical protein J3K34DRAFT_420053, partial [Monoraphidium minutum]
KWNDSPMRSASSGASLSRPSAAPTQPPPPPPSPRRAVRARPLPATACSTTSATASAASAWLRGLLLRALPGSTGMKYRTASPPARRQLQPPRAPATALSRLRVMWTTPLALSSARTAARRSCLARASSGARGLPGATAATGAPASACSARGAPLALFVLRVPAGAGVASACALPLPRRERFTDDMEPVCSLQTFLYSCQGRASRGDQPYISQSVLLCRAVRRSI